MLLVDPSVLSISFGLQHLHLLHDASIHHNNMQGTCVQCDSTLGPDAPSPLALMLTPLGSPTPLTFTFPSIKHLIPIVTVRLTQPARTQIVHHFLSGYRTI